MSSCEQILHVEPDAADREAVGAAFTAVGADVEAVADWETTAATLTASAFDCVVVGDLQGDPLAPLNETSTPVVYYADGDASFAGRAVAAGAAGYVPKGDGVDTLVERVTDLTETARKSRPTDTDRRRSLLVEQSPLAIIEWDLDFRVAGWNPAAEDLFGYDRDEAMGRSAVGLVVPEAERDAVEAVGESLLAGDGGQRLVNGNVRRDGSTVVCEWNNAPLVTDAGEVVGVLSFVRDVSDQVRRTEALEALQAKTREIMQTGTKREVADAIVEAIPDILDRPMASVRLYDEDANRLEPTATTPQVGELVDAIPDIGPGDGIIWDAFAADEYAVFDSVSVSKTVYGDQFPDAVASLSLFPLGDHGILILMTRDTGGFDETDLHLARIAAATTETALEDVERRRQLERRDTIVTAAGDGVYALNDDERYAAVNDTLLSMTGYDREELIGEPPTTLLSPADVERGRELVAELADGDESVKTYEATMYANDGERIPCEINLSLLPSEAGIEGVVGTVREISKRKEMEAAVRRQKRRIRNLHRVTSRLETCETADEVYREAVDAAERVLEFDVCVARRIGEGTPEVAAVSGGSTDGDRPPGRDLAVETHRSGQTRRIDDAGRESTPGTAADYASALSIPVGDDGVLQAFSTSAGAFDGDDEELAELLVAHADEALERVRVKRDLREERDRFAALFENVPNPVVSVRDGEDGPTFVAVNEAFERVFGYDAEQVVGESLPETIVPPDDQMETDEITSRATEGETVEWEVTRRTATGDRDFLLTVVPVDPDADPPLRYAIYTDITERKQRRKRVEVLNRVLRHDLRNGMNIIRGYAESLRRAVPPERESAVDAIATRATELTELAEKTRAVQRTLNSDARSDPVDAAEAVADAVERIEQEHPAADLRCSLPDRAPANVDALFRTGVRQVVENAVVHSDRESPSVDVEVRSDRETVVIEVSDDGPGIPAAERELLVEDREITQLRHASGLGLWLVNWVVERAGGTLSFDDDEPRGTVVTLRVPRALDAADTAPRETSDS